MRWQHYSQWYLSVHPTCVRCHNLATCVDHKVPVTGRDDPGFWEPTNHQALCAGCHSVKTKTEDAGRGRGLT